MLKGSWHHFIVFSAYFLYHLFIKRRAFPKTEQALSIQTNPALHQHFIVGIHDMKVGRCQREVQTAVIQLAAVFYRTNHDLSAPTGASP